MNSILRWKEVLLCLVPEYGNLFGVFSQRLCASLNTWFLRLCDSAHRFPQKLEAIRLLLFVYDEINYFKQTKTLDHLSVDRLSQAFRGRMQLLCGQVFDFDPSK